MLGSIKAYLKRYRVPASSQESEISADCDRGTDISKPYKGAWVSKLNNHWIPSHHSGDDAIGSSWDLLTSRVRDRVRNDPVLTKALSALQTLVVGTGLQSFSEASDLTEGDERLETFEMESDTWFERWASDEADAEGEHSFYEMQRIAFSDEVEVGNALWLEVILNDPGRTVPLAYQLLEYEQVDRTQDRDAELSRRGKGRRFNRISNGIEYDSRGRKVAYYVYDAHQFDPHTGQSSVASILFNPAVR